MILSVELNVIKLRVAKSGLLARWIPEAEIRSENALTNLAYKKECDAVVTLRLGSREVTFALEYQRTPKSRSKYDKIAEDMCREENVAHVEQLPVPVCDKPEIHPPLKTAVA